MDAATAQPQLGNAARSFLAGNHQLLIDGKWKDAKSAKRFDVVDPATGQAIAAVAEADAADVDEAVKSARRAFETGPWSKTSPQDRSKLIWKLADLLESHADEIAQLEALDNGKPIRDARNVDLPGSYEILRYMAGWATKINGETINVSAPGSWHAYTLREPIGVVGQIIPWNFPLMMAAWKIAPALAAGCTIVLKPAEQTPLSALRLGQLIQEAGFPDGVVNILTGFGETAGAALARHPDVDKVAFTGSTEVGKLIVQAAAGNLKKVSLELGGKSPAIVFPDADMDVAINGTSSAIFFNMGQCCTAGSRLYAHKRVFDRLMQGVADRAGKIRVGHGLDPQTQLGPLVSDEQFKRVTGYLEAGRQQGAKVITGGSRVGDQGYFVQPTVLTDTNRICRSCVKRSLARSCARSRSTTTISIASPAPRTTPATASPRASGRAISASPTSSRAASRPARSGSTPIISAIRRCHSAATSSRAGAVRWVMRRSSSTPKSRP
jgi:phenylacetaldehyde dehydrogenase